MCAHAVPATLGGDRHGVAIGTALDIAHPQRACSNVADERDVVTDIELVEGKGQPDAERLGERLLAHPQADQGPRTLSGRHVLEPPLLGRRADAGGERVVGLRTIGPFDVDADAPAGGSAGHELPAVRDAHAQRGTVAQDGTTVLVVRDHHRRWIDMRPGSGQPSEGSPGDKRPPPVIDPLAHVARLRAEQGARGGHAKWSVLGHLDDPQIDRPAPRRMLRNPASRPAIDERDQISLGDSRLSAHCR